MFKKKILIPLDESKQSRTILTVIQRLFRPEDSHLFLLQVVSPQLEALAMPPAHAAMEWTPAMYTYLQNYQELEHDHHLERQKSLKADLMAAITREAAPMINKGYQVKPVVRFGEPIEQIEIHIREARVDLVAMVTHAREGIGRLLFGSVAGAIVHDLSVPVLLLNPEIKSTNGETP